MIDIRSSAFLDASGDGGGTVVIRGGRLLIDNALLFAATLGSGRSAPLGMDIVVREEMRVTQGSSITTDALGAGAAGDIRLQAAQVALIGGAQIHSVTFGRGRGGTVTVTATETLSLAGAVPTPSGGTLSSGIVTTAAGTGAGAGSAGNVVVQAPRVTLTGGAQINSATSGPGQSGTVTVTATETLSLAGAVPTPSGGTLSSGIVTTAAGTGAGAGSAGNVVVQAPRMTLTAGAQISSSTAGAGHGGSITVTATDTLSIIGRDPATARPSGIVSATLGGSGTPGTVALTAPTLRLADGALIGGSPVPLDLDVQQVDRVPGQPERGQIPIVTVIIRGTPSMGQAADLSITAGILTLSGVAGIISSTPNAQPGGEIIIVADRVQLTGGARIESTSGIADAAGTIVSGPGPGGRISLTATDTVAITGQNSGLSSSTAGEGSGGEITLHARRVQLTEGATIAAASTGTGNAGNVTITASDSFLSTHGSVVTQATQADGGNIQITAANFLRLRDSAITAVVGGGQQTVGGNITIDPRFVLLQNSRISANASAGHGGNIQLQAQQVFLADSSSTVSASSALGINGQVNIQAPVTSISGSLVPLPQAFARATELLRNRCAERVRTGTASRFVLGGRDGVPLEPGSWLPSALEPLDQQPPAQSEQTPQARHSDSRGDVRIDNAGQGQGQEQYVQVRWPDRLDVECARWLGQQRTR